jgi:hypothetical protein
MEERGSRHAMRRKGEKVQGVCKGKNKAERWKVRLRMSQKKKEYIIK